MNSTIRRFRYRRIDERTRAQHRETVLEAGDFVLPIFLVPGRGIKRPLPSMPGVFHFSADEAVNYCQQLAGRGLRAVLLFGVPETKGIEQAWSEGGIVQTALPLFKEKLAGMQLITDICLCSYTRDGHCHVGDNDATCELLARISLSHARAGADMVAPSDMMDGRVAAIRHRLDTHGFEKLPILSYAAKYASSWYGPFRDAADCAPQHGDRRDYQMDPANTDEALEEIEADLREGARAIIIKPALSYLDIVRRARERFSCPIAAYNVSGEYVMLRRAVTDGLAVPGIVHETLLSIRRAGADRIITYFTPWILEYLHSGIEPTI